MTPLTPNLHPGSQFSPLDTNSWTKSTFLGAAARYTGNMMLDAQVLERSGEGALFHRIISWFRSLSTPATEIAPEEFDLYAAEEGLLDN